MEWIISSQMQCALDKLFQNWDGRGESELMEKEGRCAEKEQMLEIMNIESDKAKFQSLFCDLGWVT